MLDELVPLAPEAWELPAAGGVLHATGSVRGSPAAPTGSFRVAADGVRLDRFDVRTLALAGAFDGSLVHAERVSIDTSFLSLQAGGDVDWRQSAKPYRDAIMQFLEDNYLPDLQENIVVEHMVDPRYFQNTLNSHLGAAFSVEPILTQSAWFRPHNRSEDFENLYFVGEGSGFAGGIISSAADGVKCAMALSS